MWICLYLPELALDALCRGAEEHQVKPMVVSDPRHAPAVVIACNREARDRGVTRGVEVNAARVLVPEMKVLGRDPRAEDRALKSIAVWAGQFTSFVSLAPPCSVLLEVAGSLRLFGDTEHLVKRIHAGVIGLGFRVAVALAPTPHGASLLARAGNFQTATDRGQLESILASLPLSLLELESEALVALDSAGIRSIGECFNLPRDALARRFGTQCLHYLDRLLGGVPDPRQPFHAPKHFVSRLELLAEVECAEALVFAIRRLLMELQGTLIARDMGVRDLMLYLHHGAGEDTHLVIRLMSSTRNLQHLSFLVQVRLEQTRLRAPVRAITLKADRFAPLTDSQLDFLDHKARGRGDWQHLVEKLMARLGPEAIVGLELVADYRPEKSWRMKVPGSKVSGRKEHSRPLWLLEEPLLIRKTVQLIKGPERIESGWWDGEDIRRDYFLAHASEGVRLWVFRECAGERRWFVHGIFA